MKIRTFFILLLFTLNACAEGTAQQVSALSSVSQNTVNIDIQSEHPYQNYTHTSWEISQPGANSITIVFDRLETELNYDFVEIDGPNGSVAYRLTGNHNGESFTIDGDYTRIRLISDYSITDYGIKISHYTYESDAQEPPSTHRPYCNHIGTANEGWYWGYTNEFIKLAKCADAPTPQCIGIGTKSEGWGIEGQGLIAYDNCHTQVGIAIENEPCGGLIALTCNEGLYCQYPSNEPLHPDQSGNCKPFGTCNTTQDCNNPNNPWIHILCTGEANCVENSCVWHCTNPNPNPVWSWTTVMEADTESEHPYINNFNNTWQITKEGASKIKAHFSQIDIENYYDYIKVWSNGSNEPLYYDGLDVDFWTDEFDGDTLYIQLVSDYSITYWGFKVDYVSYYENIPVNRCNTDNDCQGNLICQPNQCVNGYAACYGNCVIDLNN